MMKMLVSLRSCSVMTRSGLLSASIRTRVPDGKLRKFSQECLRRLLHEFLPIT